MSEVLIRDGADEEVDSVIALWERCGLTRPWNDARADLRLALTTAASNVLVGRRDGELAATVMVGFDGHRGWVYYLAVDPAHRRSGLGRRMMAAAEAWLRARGAPKLNLMVREDNAAIAGFYARLEYEVQATTALGKWLAPDEGDASVNFVDSSVPAAHE